MINNVIVLAAGKGTRMNSDLPKVNHTVLEKPMINYILDTFSDFNKYVVVGYKKELVKEIVTHDVTFIEQEEQLGTGHAVKCVTELRNKKGITVVVNGDLPFVKRSTIDNAIELFKSSNASLVLLTTKLEQPNNAGRVVMDAFNNIESIVEAKDATAEQLKIKDINVGLYIFDNEKLFNYIEKINNKNNQKEYYLTDIVELLINDNQKVVAFNVSNLEGLSANDKFELANMESLFRREIIKDHLLKGVTISLDNVTIGPDVEIEPNAVIKDYTYITGKVKIGSHSVIGPFARLRDKTVIKDNCLIGNYVEIKNSTIGSGTKVSHHTYIGDSVIGENTNIGCGVITANYDGYKKHKTIIGDNCFIGSNVTLVAPLTIANDAFVAAGSVLTKSLEEKQFAVERAELVIKNRRK